MSKKGEGGGIGEEEETKKKIKKKKKMMKNTWYSQMSRNVITYERTCK